MRRQALIAALCALLSARSYAFGGTEHRRISDNAFAMARAFAATQAYSRCIADQQLILDYFNPDRSSSYGQLVVSIDHRVDPLKIFENAKVNGGVVPNSPYELDEYLVNHLLDIVALTENFRALSVDDDHFQGQALTNFELFHALAVHLATRGQGIAGSHETGSLLSGVLVNSFASHYLQDLFAPGHIVTPRYALHDAIAAGMHDKFNILGARFIVDQRRWTKLVELLDSIPKGSVLEQELHLDKDDRRAAFASTKPIQLWGDGDLWRSPDEELLLTLLTARSLVDVFESYCGAHATNSFVGSSFTPMHKEPGRKYILPHWEFAYGSMEIPDYPFTYPTVLSLTLGQEALSMPRARLAARNALEVDFFIPRQRPVHTDKNGVYRPRQPQIGLAGGYRYARARNERVHSPLIRVIAAWPLIHTQLSIDVARRRYTVDGRHEDSRTAYGLRAQSGFSILKFDIGLMRDVSFVDNVGFRRGWAVQSGITIEGPLLKIPILRLIEAESFKHQRTAMMEEIDSVGRGHSSSGAKKDAQ